MRGGGGVPARGRGGAGGKGAAPRRGKGFGYGRGKGEAEGKGKDKGKGKGEGKGAAGGQQPGGAAPADLTAICAYDPTMRAVVPVPAELAAAPLIADCTNTLCYRARGRIFRTSTLVLGPRGQVCGYGRNQEGQLGVGDRAPRMGLTAARLPWPAAAVYCGDRLCVALRRGGGAVCSWGDEYTGDLARYGDGVHPAEVRGLPEGDPVVLLDAGDNYAIAVTESGAVYGFGTTFEGPYIPESFDTVRYPQRIAALSGRGVRRISCGMSVWVAETSGGELLHVRLCSIRTTVTPMEPRGGRIAFPLRSLAVAWGVAAAADAEGRLWLGTPYKGLFCGGLPRGERVVRVARTSRAIVALTVWGRLWECREDFRGILEAPLQSLRIIGTARPPLLLLPHGGATALPFLLCPDPSCGLHRCRWLLLVAARRRGLLPGGEMVRAALVPFLVDEDFIFEELPAADGAAAERGGDE